MHLPILHSPFSLRELNQALHKQANGKAPGYDNIDVLILKNLIKFHPKIFLKLFNLCFSLGHFPIPWKIGSIIFFKKPNKPATDPGAYRPISLLPMMGKILERLIILRTSHSLESEEYLHPHQFGFREARSTDLILHHIKNNIKDHLKTFKYCSLLSIDIIGAFDNIDWPNLQQAISDTNLPPYLKNIINSFLSDRFILTNFNNTPTFYSQLKGCPQGSCLGPLLWTLLADKILKQFFPFTHHVWAYADDFTIILGAQSRRLLELRANYLLTNFSNICNSLNLQISPEKTQAILFGKYLCRSRPPIFKIHNQKIKIVSELRLLGLTFDGKFSWFFHLDHLRTKVLTFSSNITRMRGATWGLNKLILKSWYTAVTEKQLSYASSVWMDDLNCHARRKLSSIQRTAMLPIAGAYKSTSTLALGIILGIPPIFTQLKALSAQFHIKYLNHAISFENNTYSAEDFTFNEPSFKQDYLIDIPNLIFLTDNYTPPPQTTHPLLYTDGSKMPSGTAFAYTVQINNNFIHSASFRLSQHHSIYQAELLAINAALDWAISSPHSKFIIFSDNKSAIITLQQFFPSDTIAINILSKIKFHPSLTFAVGWVKAHSNIEGNEQADALAKQAILNPSPDTSPFSFPFPNSFLKYIINSTLLKEWESLWTTAPEGLYTFHFFKKPSFNIQTDDQSVVYFLTGHGSFPSFLFKIGKRDSDLCECGSPGHPLHYIFEYCPLMKHHFIRHHQLDPFANFLILIRTKQNIIKIRQNYNILNSRYSFIDYKF